MAVHTPASDDADSADDATPSGVGMAHPTVVPTNFDPDDDDNQSQDR